jgi:hypothetical protein
MSDKLLGLQRGLDRLGLGGAEQSRLSAAGGAPVRLPAALQENHHKGATRAVESQSGSKQIESGVRTKVVFINTDNHKIVSSLKWQLALQNIEANLFPRSHETDLFAIG